MSLCFLEDPIKIPSIQLMKPCDSAQCNKSWPGMYRYKHITKCACHSRSRLQMGSLLTVSMNDKY